jgi:hypothetical protein
MRVRRARACQAPDPAISRAAQVQYAAYPNINRSCARGEQFGVQIVAVLVIISWTVVCAGLALLLLQARPLSILTNSGHATTSAP